MLASVVAARFARLQTTSGSMGTTSSKALVGESSASMQEAYTEFEDYTFMYPDFNRTDLFNVGVDEAQWNSWN
jgi:hypothetical protein